MNWLKKNYPVGTKILAPHLGTGNLETAEVVNHTTDNIGQPSQANGIIARFDDGCFSEICQSFLNEDGGGFVE